MEYHPLPAEVERHDDRPRAVQPPDALPAGRPLLQHGVRLLGRELQASGRSSWRTASPTTARPTVFFNFDRIGGDRRQRLDAARLSQTRWSRDAQTTKVMHERRRPAGRGAAGRARHHPALHQGLRSSRPTTGRRCKAERFRRDDPARKVDVAALQAGASRRRATTRWASTAAR